MVPVAAYAASAAERLLIARRRATVDTITRRGSTA